MKKLHLLIIFVLGFIVLGAIPSTIVDDANRNKQVRAVAIIDGSGVQTGTSTNRLKVTTDNPRTAFGELLVAEVHPIFQGSFEYTVDNTELNTNLVSGSGGVTQGSGMASIGTGVTTASTALFRSKQHGRYRAGIGGVARFTVLFTSPVSGTAQYVGILDATSTAGTFANGYAVGYDGTTFGFHRWANSATTTVALSAWDDPLDGSGASEMTIDQTKLNIFYIQYQYLGAGAIRIFVEDDDTGMPTLVHTVDYANQNTEPSVHNPNFHMTYYTSNLATTSDIIVKSSSYMYAVEGKTKFIELHQQPHSTDIVSTGTVTTEQPIFTIRNRATYTSKTNFIDIILKYVSASIEANSANNLGNIKIIKNATLGGASTSYSNISTDTSVVEIDTSATTVTGGTVLMAVPLAGKNDKFVETLIPLKLLLNPNDTITISATSANSATINAALLWTELF